MTANSKKCTGRAFSPRQEAAALALASGQSRDQAAHLSGAKLRTVCAWLLMPAFRDRVNELRAEMTQRALGILADNAAAAARKIVALMSSESERVQLRAADTLLEKLLRFTELVNHEERIAALERSQQKVHGSPHRGRVA
jgi:hypothetical protein